MANSSAVILSSSPSCSGIAITPPPRNLFTTFSSSPSLPSPTKVIAQKHVSLDSPSNLDMPRSSGLSQFLTASDLLRQAQMLNGEAKESAKLTGSWTENDKAMAQTEPNPQAAVISGENLEKESKETIARQPKAKSNQQRATKSNKRAVENNRDPDNVGTHSRKGKAVRIKLDQKSKHELQITIKKAKVTKPGVRSKAIPKHMLTTLNAEDENTIINYDLNRGQGKDLDCHKSPGLGLTEAVKRRRGWTPTKDTIKGSHSINESHKVPENPFTADSNLIHLSSTSKFETAVDNCRYAQHLDGLRLDMESRNDNNRAVTKRRKIDLVNLISPMSGSLPPKPSVPKKKAQTITDKATAPFLAEGSPIPLLPQFSESLDSRTDEDKQKISQPPVGSFSTFSLHKSTKKVSVKTGALKSKKKSTAKSILLSPESAMKSVDNQAVIFGTSSQLVYDDFPDLLRNENQAAEASASACEIDYEMTTEGVSNHCETNSFKPEPTASSSTTKKNLWARATRDLNGSLLTPEIVDLSNTPKQLDTSKIRTIISVPPSLQAVYPVGTSDERFETFSNTSHSKSEGAAFEGAALAMGKISVVESPIPKSIAEASLRQRRSKSPVKNPQVPKKSSTSTDPALPPKPNYQGFTDAELFKTVTSYGFKPIKKRVQMIALLERCWESQTRVALQALTPNIALQTPCKNDVETAKEEGLTKKKRRSNTKTGTSKNSIEQTDVSPPKKPRGRPRKIKGELAPLDSRPAITEQQIAAIPPGMINAQGPSPLQSILPVSKSIPSPSAQLKSDSSFPPVDTLITRAVTSEIPNPSCNPPTFHERILLYDPILLEDLTRWLNTKGLSLVECDDEVGTGVVKEWCEKRSVCWISNEEGWRAKRK